MKELTILDLKEMDHTSVYCREVLLDMQEKYERLRQQGSNELDLETFYKHEKSNGRGVDLGAYVKAAGLYFREEIESQIRLLKTQPERLMKELGDGSPFSLEVHAKRLLFILARISSLLEQAKPIFGDSLDRPTQAEMSKVIGQLKTITDNNANRVGVEMLKLAASLGKANKDATTNQSNYYPPMPWNHSPKDRE